MHYSVTPNVFSTEECTNIIRIANTIGFEPATIGNDDIVNEVRNNSRVIFHSEELANILLNRLDIPEHFNDQVFDSINTVFRVYEYTDGQYFKPHKDNLEEYNGTVNLLTVLIYLNSCITGATLLMPFGQAHSWAYKTIYPEEGSALIFDANVTHAGNLVVNETKLVLRTDMLYKI